jgi:hypothetical protein
LEQKQSLRIIDLEYQLTATQAELKRLQYAYMILALKYEKKIADKAEYDPEKGEFIEREGAKK